MGVVRENEGAAEFSRFHGKETSVEWHWRGPRAGGPEWCSNHAAPSRGPRLASRWVLEVRGVSLVMHDGLLARLHSSDSLEGTPKSASARSRGSLRSRLVFAR